jgi:hypothetical protein
VAAPGASPRGARVDRELRPDRGFRVAGTVASVGVARRPGDADLVDACSPSTLCEAGASVFRGWVTAWCELRCRSNVSVGPDHLDEKAIEE